MDQCLVAQKITNDGLGLMPSNTNLIILNDQDCENKSSNTTSIIFNDEDYENKSSITNSSIFNCEDPENKSTTIHNNLKIRDEKYYASRRIFLRSYKLSKKESGCTKIKKWLKNKLRALIKNKTSGGSDFDE